MFHKHRVIDGADGPALIKVRQNKMIYFDGEITKLY